MLGRRCAGITTVWSTVTFIMLVTHVEGSVTLYSNFVVHVSRVLCAARTLRYVQHMYKLVAGTPPSLYASHSALSSSHSLSRSALSPDTDWLLGVTCGSPRFCSRQRQDGAPQNIVQSGTGALRSPGRLLHEHYTGITGTGATHQHGVKLHIDLVRHVC